MLGYFPSSRPWMTGTHPPRARPLAALPRSRTSEIALEDLADASLAALASHPELVLVRGWRTQTSYFERLERDDPRGLHAGLVRLRGDLHAGRAPRAPRAGDRDPLEQARRGHERLGSGVWRGRRQQRLADDS